MKSIDPPETVTDALELVNDTTFKAEQYRTLAADIFTDVRWTADTGEAMLSGMPVSLESTDAGIIVILLSPLSQPQILHGFVRSAMEAGAVVISADSGEIVSGNLSA